jgi:AcrR family transcriptional regulator
MAGTDRPLRADAERNRRRIVAAAHAVFARDGLDAGVDVVAREAGVGIGTLYRRFPTKRDLIAAILEDLSAAMLARIETVDDADPWAALTATLRVFAEQVARDRGLFDALKTDMPSAWSLGDMRNRLLDALEPRLAAAQAAGAARADLSVTDLLPVVAAVARIRPIAPGGDAGLWERYLAVVLDGLRAEGASPLPRQAPPRRLN